MARWFPNDPHRREYDQERRVRIGDHELLAPDLSHLDAEFFVELSARRVGVRLPRLALAAGELPEPTVSLVMRPLTYEELVSARDDGGNYANHCHSERSEESSLSR